MTSKKNEKSTNELLEEISKKLDGIFAVLSLKEIQDVDDKIRMLKKIGLSSDEIGPYVGMKGTSIRDKKGWKNK